MSFIGNLTAANSSYVLGAGNYVDISIFAILIIIFFGSLIISRCLAKDENGQILFGLIAVLVGVAMIWASMSVSISSYAQSGSIVINTTNTTTTTNYYNPTHQMINSNWFTFLLVVFEIIGVLNVALFLLGMYEDEKMKKRSKKMFSEFGIRRI